MLRLYASEKFVEVPLDVPTKNRYAVSNYGRLLSFKEDINQGTLIKGGLADGYKTLRFNFYTDGVKKTKHLFVYRLVAEIFIPKDSDAQTNVLHLDHSRNNDKIANLKWATRAEMVEHHKKSPAVIRGRAKTVAFNIKNDGRKLTVTQVMRLKKELLNPNRKTRLRILAKQFNVSEMQLHRIKTGENWGHIKV